MVSETDRAHRRSDREATAKAIRGAVLEGLREFMWSHEPGCVHQFAPPRSVDSEERIVSALLCGHARLADVRPLTAASFFIPLHRHVVQALDALGNVEGDVAAAVIAKLEEAGCTGPIAAAVIELRDGVPFVLRLDEHVARVHEAARARRLLDFLADLEADVRLERVTTDEAIAKLRATLERGRRAA